MQIEIEHEVRLALSDFLSVFSYSTTLSRKRLSHMHFSVNFAKLLRTPFLRLLLYRKLFVRRDFLFTYLFSEIELS